MATNFPTSLDTLTNPSGSDTLASPDHAGQHSDANDAIEALQAKVGVDGSAVTTSLDYKVSILVPTGAIIPYAGSTAPAGWLLCNTATPVSRSTYAALFAVIGTTYGAGNGSTTFNLPFLSGRAPIGAGTGSGLTARSLADTGGDESVTLTGAQSGTSAHGHANTIAASTGNASADHSHTTSVDPPSTSSGTVSSDHAHYTGAHGHSYLVGNLAQAGTNRSIVSASGGSVGGGAIYNADAGWSGGISANHSHATDIGAFNATSGGQSVTHTHSVTVSGSVTDSTEANATAAHTNMQPFLALNYIIKI